MIASLQGGAKPPQAPEPPVTQTAPAVFPTGGQPVQTSPFPQVVQAAAPPVAFGCVTTPFGGAAPPTVSFPAAPEFTAPPPLNFGSPVVAEVPGVVEASVPAFTPPPAVTVPEPKKRIRRTKEQIAADEAAKAQAQVTKFQTPEGALVGEIQAPVQFSATEAAKVQLPPPQFGEPVVANAAQVIDPEIAAQPPVQFAAPEQKEWMTEVPTEDPLDPLVRELALAMACNPAYGTMPAGDFAARAWSLAEALRGL
jgi:hypothetical protein